MPASERSEFVGVIKGELDYLRRLVEDLFFIADLQEPRYTQKAQDIDLVAAVNAEVAAVSALGESVPARGINIEVNPPSPEAGPISIAGDPYMRRTQRVIPKDGDTFASLGLGTVIIKSVAASHGGTIKIASVQAGDAVIGTRLTFLFPRSTA